MISVARMSLFALPLLTLALPPSTLRAQEEADPDVRGTEAGAQVPTIEVAILGMTCSFCAYGVEQKLKKLEGLSELTVDLEGSRAILEMDDDADVSNETLLRAVDDAGFECAAITRNFESEFPDYAADEQPSSGTTEND